MLPARQLRGGEPVWASGDTVVFRVAIENQSAVPADSFTFKAGFGPARRYDVFRRIIQLKERTIPQLPSNQRVQFIDTAVVAAETRATALRFALGETWDSAGATAPGARLAGDTIVPVLSSGFELEMAGVPHQTWMAVWNEAELWANWWSYTPYTVVLRVLNPYEVTLEPFRLTWCEIDEDYCPVDGEVESLTPRVPPGESRELQIPFVLKNTDTALFWDHEFGVVAICYPRWLRGTCAKFNVQVLPAFEAECTVPTVQPGQQITDSTQDCDGTGSVYSFAAKAGERYRVTASLGSAFIVGAEGKHRYDPMLTEITIPQDGEYYVVLDQRLKLTATFTLVRL